MSMSITGMMHVIGEEQQVSDRFRKREFVLKLTENPRYPQLCQFQLSQECCDMLGGIAVGDEVTVQFDLQGREWTNPEGQVKYFNTLDAWAVVRVSDMSAQPSNPTPVGESPF